MSAASVIPPPTLETNEQGDAALDHDAETQLSNVSETAGSHAGEGGSGERPRDVEDEPFSRFSTRQKMIITTLVSLASILSPMSATIYVPALPTIAKDLDVSVTLVNLSVTSYMIFQGLSPSLWGSITDVVGRRPVYLVTMVVYIGACLGLAFTRNYAELIVFRCLQSIGSASSIAIGAGVIGDITQRRERGGYIGVYSAGSLVGNALGPILGGIFAETIGWHGIFYFLTALAGLLQLTVLLFLPETLRSIVGNGKFLPPPPRLGAAPLTFLAQPILPWLVPSGASQRHRDADSKAGAPTTRRRQIDLLGPLKMMGQADVFCGLVFTGLTYTVWQATLVATASLFTDTYGLSEISVGLCFIANGVGAVSASLITGKVLNRDYRRAQRSEKRDEQQLDLDLRTTPHSPPRPLHGGDEFEDVVDDDDVEMARQETSARQVSHIEHARLLRAPIVMAIFIAATLSYGWCLEARTTIALPILWTFCTGFTTTAIMSMFSTLIVDWYPNAGASATAAINLARCLLGAGGTAVVQPMIERLGVGWTFTVGAGIAIASLPLGILTYVRGEHWRQQREAKILAKERLEET